MYFLAAFPISDAFARAKAIRSYIQNCPATELVPPMSGRLHSVEEVRKGLIDEFDELLKVIGGASCSLRILSIGVTATRVVICLSMEHVGRDYTMYTTLLGLKKVWEAVELAPTPFQNPLPTEWK